MLRLSQNNTALEWMNKCCIAPAAFRVHDSLLNIKYMICLWSSYILGDIVTGKEGKVDFVYKIHA